MEGSAVPAIGNARNTKDVHTGHLHLLDPGAGPASWQGRQELLLPSLKDQKSSFHVLLDFKTFRERQVLEELGLTLKVVLM